MKKLLIGLVTTMAWALAVTTAGTNAGCGSSKGSGGSGGADGGAGTGGSIPLTPSDTGFFDGSNAAGILGAWYSYGDWYNPTAAMGDCAIKGGFTADQCSSIASPIPGTPFMKTANGMCTNGTVAKVVSMAGSTTPDYSDIWGAGIGFDLNNAGTDDGGTGGKLPFDATLVTATKMAITGFSFHIDTPPTGGQMRVEFPTNKVPGTTDINSAYWGGATANLSPFTKGGDVSFHFKDVGGPMYLTSPTPFDPTMILSMQFHVVSNTSSTIPFMYCISNLKALTD